MRKTKQDLTLNDLKEIARIESKKKGLVNRIQINTTKESILKICRDEATHSKIDIIRSASIQVSGVWFELINKDGKN